MKLPVTVPARGIAAGLCACVLVLCAAKPAKNEPGTDQYFSGNAFYNKKLYSLAVKEYSEFMRKYPRHSKHEHARYGLALSYFALKDYKNAEQQLREVVKQGKVGNKDHLNLLRGQCFLKMKNRPEAEKTFKAVVDSTRNPKFKAGAIAGLTEMLFQQKKWKETAPQADALLKIDPNSGYTQLVLYQSAFASRELSDMPTAIRYLETLGKQAVKEPLKSRAAYLLAECYRQTGEMSKAAIQYSRAARGLDGPIGAEVLYRLGFVNFAQKKYDAAIESLEKALKGKLKGGLADEARFYLGRSLFEKGEVGKARPIFESVSKGRSNLAPKAVLWLARASGAQAKHGEAAGVLKDAAHRFQKDGVAADLFFEQGNALVAEGNYKEAAHAFGQVLRWQKWPQRNDALRLYAICLHRAGDFQNSLKRADEFIRQYKNDKELPQVRFLRAENLYLMKKLDEAAKAYEAYAKAYPDDPKSDAAMFRVAQAYHRKQKWQEALETAFPLAEKGLKGGAFSQLRFVIGDSFFRLEKWSRAIKMLDEFLAENADEEGNIAASKEPNLDAALMELAFAKQKIGDKTGAARYFAQAATKSGGGDQAAVALAQRGRLQYESEEYVAARETFEAFIAAHEKSPLRAQVEYYYGWLELKLGNVVDAARHFATIARSYQKDPVAPDATLQLGLIQMGREDFKSAAGTLRQLLSLYKEHPRKMQATYSCGLALARSGRQRDAVEYFKTVVDKYPKSEFADKALYEWAWCEKSMNRKPEAVKVYKRLLSDYAQSELAEKVRLELAEYTADAKSFDEAVAELEGVLAKNNNAETREQILPRLAMVHSRHGDNEKCAEILEGWIAEFTNSTARASVLFQAGECRMRLREMIRARELFSEVCSIPKTKLRESAMLRLGETQGLTRRWTDSQATYETFLKEYPKSKWTARAQFGLAWALEKQRKYEEAMGVYRKAAAGSGRHGSKMAARSRFQIGECLFALRRYDEALAAFEQVMKDFKRDRGWVSKALLETARVLENKGELDEAMATFKEVIKKYPKNDVAVVAKQRLDILRRRK